MPERFPARTRLLDAATRLFYAEGVHAVGIDRIIAEAGIAKATFYHHFPSKDDLVCAYVDEQSEIQRDALTAAVDAASDDPMGALRDYFEHLGEAGSSPAYRGCPIVNVAVEYPDERHAIRQAIADHRRWFRESFRKLLTAGDHPHPDLTADVLVLVRDGLLVGLDLDDPSDVRPAIREVVAKALEGPVRPQRSRRRSGSARSGH
jgi:AcrR family transcriptional regulator